MSAMATKFQEVAEAAKEEVAEAAKEEVAEAAKEEVAEAATKIRKEKPWEQLTPNYYTDNAPPDSGEGLELDDYGSVEGHPYWGQWIPELNLWVMVCSQDAEYWYWDAEERVWIKDESIYDILHGK